MLKSQRIEKKYEKDLILEVWGTLLFSLETTSRELKTLAIQENHNLMTLF